MLLSDVLPEYHFRERHARRLDAPPERVFTAVRELTVGDSRIVRVLVRLRGLHASASRPVFDEMGRAGFAVVGEEPGREVVIAAVGRPWQLRRGQRPPVTDFRAFADPGYAKMAMNFRLDEGVLSTETRVLLTDEHSRRAFRRYWFVIRPFSGLIRRLWLGAIARRALS